MEFGVSIGWLNVFSTIISYYYIHYFDNVFFINFDFSKVAVMFGYMLMFSWFLLMFPCRSCCKEHYVVALFL